MSYCIQQGSEIQDSFIIHENRIILNPSASYVGKWPGHPFPPCRPSHFYSTFDGNSFNLCGLQLQLDNAHSDEIKSLDMYIRIIIKSKQFQIIQHGWKILLQHFFYCISIIIPRHAVFSPWPSVTSCAWGCCEGSDCFAWEPSRCCRFPDQLS